MVKFKQRNERFDFIANVCELMCVCVLIFVLVIVISELLAIVWVLFDCKDNHSKAKMSKEKERRTKYNRQLVNGHVFSIEFKNEIEMMKNNEK